MNTLQRLLVYVLVGLCLWLAGLGIAHAAPNCERHKGDDLITLACNIYWEARNETVEGMMAIVAVTLNRVASAKYPDTIREVVWQRRQFSWTHDGKVDRPNNRPSWKQSLRIASRFAVSKAKRESLCGAPTPSQIMAEMLGRPDPGEGCDLYDNLVNVHVYLVGLVDPTGGALFYHAAYVLPYWIWEEKRVKKIGRHVFYTAARIR